MSQTITAINHHSTTDNSTTRTAALRVAFYARVSSELQAQEQTIASQVAALKERESVEAVILAGTELPLVLTDTTASGIPLLDTTSIHVQAAAARLWGPPM